MTDIINLKENKSIVNMSNIDISEPDLKEIDNSVIKYKIEYYLETNTIKLEVILEQFGESYVDEIYGSAFYNENEQLDAMFLIDGEIVLLSELEELAFIENVGWFSRLTKVVASAVVAVVVSPVVSVVILGYTVTEGVLGAKNYFHNKKQSIVNSDGYIYDQDNYNNWKMGIKRLDYNGCGPISIYNAVKLAGKTPDLKDIIFNIEMTDGTLGLGRFGTDPTHMGETLNNLYHINSKMYVRQSSFENDIEEGKIIILGYWNDRNNYIEGGAHYVAAKKVNGEFQVYNLSKTDGFSEEANIKSIIDDGKFLVGYILK